MANSAKNNSPRRSPLKRVLSHPLTWIAVGLHALLLVVPFNPKPAVAPDLPEEETPEEVTVDILNLSDIATSTPPPETPPPPENTPPPVPQAAPPVPSAVPPPTADEIPAEPEPSAPEPSVPDPPAEPPPPPAYDPSQDQQVFINNLGAINLGDYTDTLGLPDASNFRNPGNAGAFVSNGAPVAGARSARWMDKPPDSVLGELQTTYARSGIQFNPLAPYGGEALYELITPDGQSFMYISLAALEGSSLLVIWQANPLSVGG